MQSDICYEFDFTIFVHLRRKREPSHLVEGQHAPSRIRVLVVQLTIGQLNKKPPGSKH